jgi:hypothetical protein
MEGYVPLCDPLATKPRADLDSRNRSSPHDPMLDIDPTAHAKVPLMSTAPSSNEF